MRDTYFAENLRTLRRARNLTQEELGEAVSVSRAVIGSYEERRAQPPIETIIDLCEYFEVSVERMYLEKIELITKDQEE